MKQQISTIVRPNRLAIALAAIVGAGAALSTPTANAQSAGGSKIGVVNVAVVSSKIQELKAFGQRIKDEQTALEQQVQGHQASIRVLQDKINQLKPDSPDFERQVSDAQDKAAGWQLEDQKLKAQVLREISKQNKKLFMEIQQVVTDVAKKRGLDLVIVEPEVQLPVSVQNVDPQQLNQLISQKTVLFASPNIDLTDEVATELDARFKASGGAAAATTPPPAGK